LIKHFGKIQLYPKKISTLSSVPKGLLGCYRLTVWSCLQRQQIVSLACDKSENHGIEMTTWTQEMLAEAKVQQHVIKNGNFTSVEKLEQKIAQYNLSMIFE
jgi:hypothetical protein